MLLAGKRLRAAFIIPQTPLLLQIVLKQADKLVMVVVELIGLQCAQFLTVTVGTEYVAFNLMRNLGGFR